MSCISLVIGKPNTGGMAVTPLPIGGVSVGAEPTGWFDIDVLNKTPSISASKVGSVSIGIYLVCRATTGEYLRVSPVEAQYIWVDKSIDYNIESNTDWFVN